MPPPPTSLDTTDWGQHALLVQSPAQPAQLIVLFHGVGSSAASMQDAAQALTRAFERAMVVAVHAPHPSDYPGGHQWFSVVGVTEENRQARVDAAMPAFAACVAYWQARAGLGPQATALVGFSQGAIMALESTKHSPALCSRVVAIAGRFASLPDHSTYPGTIHFLHGKEDGVISYEHTVFAAHALRHLQVDMTAEVRPFIGHEIHPEFVALMVDKLGNHISHHLLQAAIVPDEKAP